MAIGALLGEQHSFMHDLESFFWVLFWICIHYNGPTEGATVVQRFDRWNYADTEELAELKFGLVGNENHFLKRSIGAFHPYYQSLVQWVNRLRRLVFPMDKPWEREDRGLYSKLKQVLGDAKEDSKVIGKIPI